MRKNATPADKVIEALGGTVEAARALGLTPNVVWNWRKRQSIPAERVLQVEQVTGISRHELRPDIFGSAA